MAPHAPYSVSPALLQAIARASAREAAQHPSRRVGAGSRSSCATARASGARCSNVSACGTRVDAVPACGPVELSRSSRAGRPSTCSPSTACSSRTRSWRAWRRRARRVVDLSAQQPVDRRRRSADRPLLRVGRPRRGRHRQPGQRRRPEPVRGAGGGAAARPRRRRRARSSRARRSPAPRRSASPPSSARSSPASAPSSSPSAYRPDVTDVEEYLLSGIDSRSTSGGVDELRA